jgi:hypothetical protein
MRQYILLLLLLISCEYIYKGKERKGKDNKRMEGHITIGKQILL